MDFYLWTDSGFECHGQATLRGRDVGFAVDEFEGWGPVEVDDRDRPRVGDGDFSLPARRRPRLVTVGGQVMGDTWGDLRGFRDQLASLPVAGDVIHVTELGETLRVYGGVRGKPVFEPAYSSRVPLAFWEVTFKAPDPYKYGEARRIVASPGESVELVNRGSTDSWPTIRIDGPVSACTVRLGARTARITVPLASGQWAEIDTRTGQASSNAAPGGRMLSELQGTMPLLVPGVSTAQVEATGAGNVTFTVTDTYL